MRIDINQAKVAITDKYKIYVDESREPRYRAVRRFWRVLAEVDLLNDGGETPLLTVKKRFSAFGASYYVLRSNQSYAFTTLSFWKPRYRCIIDGDQYDIYGHRKRKYSIFKNEKQVAWWDKAPISWFAGDNYRIVCDDDADIQILLAFCLIIDNYRSDDHDGDAAFYDVGNLIEARKFDPDWKPRVLQQT